MYYTNKTNETVSGEVIKNAVNQALLKGRE